MHVDIAGALADQASPGVARSSLDRLDDRVADAHERIEAGRAAEDFGYAALNLPETTDIAAIHSAADRIVDATDRPIETVLVAGIGGSALGAATLASAVETDATVRTLDNVDPAATRELLDSVDLERAALVGVSRSGTTVETLANVQVVRGAFEDAGVDWTERTLVVTGESGPLRRLAEEADLPALAVPDGVPGRFSALSPVALAPVALAGGDVEAILAGGAAGADSLAGSLFECPAYAYGAVSAGLAQRGAAVSAMVPYSEALDPFGEWFAQLWAESLGKDGVGQVPQRALGATDQHSQLQCYRDGPRSTMVTTVRPQRRPELSVPDPSDDELAHLRGTELGELLDLECAATTASLTAADRPVVRVEIDRIDARGIGELCYGFEAACVLAGELFGVNAFDQPAVEWGKDATRALLRGEETPETRAIDERESLWIE
ncbi:glucose-6-phosphate isomerase [Salinarchaeum chitinilyticum]